MLTSRFMLEFLKNYLVSSIQRSAKVFVRGCEKFVIALAYLFCLALVGSCLARFAYFLADLCRPKQLFSSNSLFPPFLKQFNELKFHSISNQIRYEIVE